MTKQRVYDLGNGVTISDDGLYFRADVVKSDKTSISVGIRRPLLKMPEEVDILYGLTGKFYYLPQFAEMHSFWLSVDTFSNRQSMPKELDHPLNDYARFTNAASAYTRILLPFSFWSIKSGEKGLVSFTSALAKDYISLIQEELKKQEKIFNDVISPCGKTLSWFTKQVGEWVPFPPDPPPIKLC